MPRAWSTPRTSSAATRSTATSTCPPSMRATAACGCPSRTPRASSTGSTSAIASSSTRSVALLMDAKETLLRELRRHALILGEVTLTSGLTAQYYVDAKRAILRPTGFRALAELVAGYARDWEATAVGGLTLGADAPACAALAGGADVKAFFVRKETKAHGLQRKVEGPPLDPGERCLIVEDVVTLGGSAVQAIEAVQAQGHVVCGVVSVLDRLAGGAEAIRLATGDAPYAPLATIDELYPDRPDRD